MKQQALRESHLESFSDRVTPPQDIRGRKFGRLTALAPTGKADARGSMLWYCRCDCGREVTVSRNRLMYTSQQSCGCQKREHDAVLHTFLTHLDGTSLNLLKSKKRPAGNTTGCRGVYLIRGSYTAKIVFQKKAWYLGSFPTLPEAAAARKAAEEVLFDRAVSHYEAWLQRAKTDPGWALENPVQVRVTQNANKTLSVTLLPKL